MFHRIRTIVRNRVVQVAVAGIALLGTAGTAAAQYGPAPSYANQNQQPGYGQQGGYNPYSQGNNQGYNQQANGPYNGQSTQPGFGQPTVTRADIDAEIQQITVPQLRQATPQQLMQSLQELQMIAQQVQQARAQLNSPTDPRMQEIELAEYAVARLTVAVQQELQSRQMRNNTGVNPPEQPVTPWQPQPDNTPPANDGFNPFDNGGVTPPLSNNPFDR